jgi:type I restriction enzyme S subunit
MPSNYKRLGDYIQEVNIRNRDLSTIPLLGVSIKKVLMPSIANIIGTDMSTYKLIKKNQFSYGPVTSRNGDKISIALLEENDNAMVSQAYTVFEVIDENELLPEYLMMWFRRPEFDRYARFMSHGSAREIFSWTEICETLLPIPTIEKQQEIVQEYNIIQNRIALNNQLINKLEETAQAIYKQWFVDFEFPNENGKPYKSNDGKMVWCEELEKEIPEGWEYISFLNICEIGSSKRIYEYEYCETGIPFYRGKEITLKKNGLPIREPYFISNDRYNELVKIYGKPSEGDILLTAVGTIGSSYMVSNEDFYFKDGNIIWLKNFNNQFLNYFIYDFMQTDSFNELIDEITIGSTQSAITITTLNEQKIIIPTLTILEKYSTKSRLINQNRFFKIQENLKLEEFKELLLARMTRVESEKIFI